MNPVTELLSGGWEQAALVCVGGGGRGAFGNSLREVIGRGHDTAQAPGRLGRCTALGWWKGDRGHV